MKKSYFILILIFAVFLSCGRKNNSNITKARSSDIVSSTEMKNILVDVMLAEGAAGISQTKSKNVGYYTKHYYNYIFKKYNITSEQFQMSYSYYASDLDKMNKLITDVIDDLSQKQSKVKNE